MRTVLALLLLTTLAPAAAARKSEPRYKGKPLAYWVERLQKAESDKEQAAAAVAVQAFGPDAVAAVPVLIEMLDDRSPEFRQLVYATLRELGPAARGAVPDLVRMLRERRPRNTQYAIWLLEKIGPDAKEAVPELAKFLDSAPYRDDAANALCSVGPAAKDALPALRSALLDAVAPEPAVCEVSDPTLNRLHQLGPDAVPLLTDLIASETPKGMAYGISGLGKIGPGAAKAAPRLSEFLKRDDLELRREAAIALCRIEKNVKAVAVLSDLLREKTFHARAAAEALEEMGPDAKATLPALRAALGHEDFAVRLAARRAITRIEAVRPEKN